jgi:PAS domain S-box-containing protein
MRNRNRLISLLCAWVALIVGLSGVLAYVFQPKSAVTLVELFKQMGLNSPVMCLLAGAVMYLTGKDGIPGVVAKVRTSLALLLIGAAAACASQYVLNIDLGIDFVRVPTAPTLANPYPGRPTPNACLSFLIAGIGLLLAQRTNLRYPAPQLVKAMGWVVLVIAGAAMAGYILDLAPLYKITKLNFMVPTTACALAATGAWLAMYQDDAASVEEESVASHGRKINSRVAAILLVVVSCTAVAGFTILRGGLEHAVLENIYLTVTTNATSLANTLESRLWFPRTIVSRPSVVDTFRKLHANPGDAEARRFLGTVGDSFLTAGLAYVRFETADGVSLASSGIPIASRPVAIIALQVKGQRAHLLWQDGYMLSVENDVWADGVLVGKVRSEERLPSFEKLVTDIQKSGPSSDVLICGREDDVAVCAPSRIYSDSRRIPMFDRNGKPNLPINRALLNETGTLRVLDLRQVPVLAAYSPIGNYALGMVVKIDEEVVYAPIRQRFTELGGAVLLIIVLGAVAVRIQVRPLLARLVREQTRTRVILENSNDAFIAIDENGLVRDWNAQAVKLFGWTETEAVGRELSDLIIPPELRAAHRAGLARFAAAGDGPVINKTIEVAALRRDGGTFTVELSVTGYRDGDRYVSNAFVRDISERKAAEKRITESETFLRTVTDNIPAFVAYVDAEERYRFANAMYKHKLGIDPVEMYGRKIRDIVGDATYGNLKEHIDTALSGRQDHFEMPVLHPGSEQASHLMFDYIPEFTRDGTVAGFHILAMDISVRKNAELRQAESERKADMANRAKSEFVANISHEIRTPMNAVLCIAHLLGATPLAADQRNYLEMIRKSGTSLLGLLNDVLDFSKIEAGQMEIVPARFVLNDLLNAVATIMTINAGDKDIELVIGVEPGVPTALIGDRLRLEQVLTNIVGNAIKFTAAGEVALLVEKISEADSAVEIQFVVRDTGIGMSDDHLGKIFNAFSQGDSSMTRRFGGTGLGLVISRRLVRMMGGDIHTESEAGVGSVFRVSVPLELDYTAADAGVGTGFARPLRVLVIDDNATSLDYLCKSVSLRGWTAVPATSGSEGLRCLAEANGDGERFDVVLADLDMPDLDGVQTMRGIRDGAGQDRIPVVIMVSAFKRSALAGGADAEEADAILLKPVTGSSLFDTLHEVLTQNGKACHEPRIHQAQQLRRLDGARILLTEDNELNQVVAKGILEAAGAQVEIAGDGRAAVERLRADPTGFDLVLMDVQMPVLDGFAATRLIRDQLKLSIPVIAMTAGVMADERENCIGAGMIDFIGKPVDVTQMLDTIARHWKRVDGRPQARTI